MKQLFLTLAVLALLLSGCKTNRASLPEPTATPAVQEDIPAEDICFYDDQSAALTLSDAFGTPILLKFWAAEHADAESELRALNHAYALHKDDVCFFLIDLTADASKREELFERCPDIVPPFPRYFDPDGSCRAAYGLTGTQGSFFIDRDGFLATWVDGSINEEALLFGLKMI